MLRIDAWLLRRVFQPVVDWLAPWCSRFWLARQCLGVAMILILIYPFVYAVARWPDWWAPAMVLAANVFVVYIWRGWPPIWGARERREERGWIDPPSLHRALTRMIYIMTTLSVSTIAAVSDAWTWLQPVGFALATVALFLVDCSAGTTRRVFRWAEA